MFNKGIAILSLTKQGIETAIKIRNVLNKAIMECTIFAPRKYAQKGIVPLDERLSEFIGKIFDKVDAIIAVMATGITVRSIAPYLKSKISDPAIVSVDDLGKFAISLVSGHYRGANELTRLIAYGIGAIPVITTASDVLGKKSVEELARILHCEIKNPKSLVAVNSALVNGEKLVVVLTEGVKTSLNKIWEYEIKTAKRIDQAIEIINDYDAGIIITKEEVLPQDKLKKPATILKPKKIIIGIGSRKDVNENEVIEAVNFALAQTNIPLERVDRLATINIKKDSNIVKAAKILGLSIDFIDINALRSFKHKDLSPDSKIVEQNIGIGGVCERVALIVAGEKARLILKKTKVKGVTVAIAEGE
ncbi:MAG: cobalamin biosynthesis protein [Nitrososphaerales archaeon]